MKLTDRPYLQQTRYSQSFTEFANRTKLMNSTTNSSGIRLPQLSRSFSSSTKNNMQKMGTMQDNLKFIQKQVRDLRLETRQSKRYCNFLKEDLIDRRLAGTNNDIRQQVNNMDKFFKMTKHSNEQRTSEIKDDCKKIANSSNAIKNMLNLLNQKINAIENVMGIYNGKQKHRI